MEMDPSDWHSVSRCDACGKIVNPKSFVRLPGGATYPAGVMLPAGSLVVLACRRCADQIEALIEEGYATPVVCGKFSELYFADVGGEA